MWDKVRGQLETNPIEDLKVAFITTRVPYSGRAGTYLAGPFYFVAGLLRAAVLMALRRVDLLHVSLASGGSTVRKLRFVALARLFRVPYVVHLRGGGFQDYWSSRSAPMARTIDRMFDGAASIIVLGTFWRKIILDRLPGLGERIVVLPNATAGRAERSAPRGSKAPVHILYLGRLERLKGTPELVEALSRLQAAPEWVATLAGDGDMAETRDAVARAGLEGRVALPGWIDDRAVDEKLDAADILVLPSYHEGLPNAVVEAFGHGLAVVTTPVGALPDIVEHDSTGLFVEPGDANGLAAAIDRLIEDEPLRRMLGDNARKVHRDKLDIAHYLGRLVWIWRDAADGS